MITVTYQVRVIKYGYGGGRGGLTQKFEGLAIQKGSAKRFHPFKKKGGGGAQKALPGLDGPVIFLFYSMTFFRAIMRFHPADLDTI